MSRTFILRNMKAYLETGFLAVACEGVSTDCTFQEVEGLSDLVLANVNAGRDPVLDRVEETLETALRGNVCTAPISLKPTAI